MEFCRPCILAIEEAPSYYCSVSSRNDRAIQVLPNKGPIPILGTLQLMVISNEELWAIKRTMKECKCHTLRKGESKVVKKFVNCNRQGQRRRTRPRERVEDVQRTMSCGKLRGHGLRSRRSFPTECGEGDQLTFYVSWRNNGC